MKINPPPKTLTRIVLGTAGFYFFVIATTILLGLFTNAARDAEKPFDQELRKAGAVLVCSWGDSGYGPDNTTPWYHASYVLTGDRGNAEEILMQIAAKHGFKIEKATRNNRGPVQVADIYLDRGRWYFDDSSHTARSPLLQKGKIFYEFSFSDEKLKRSRAIPCDGRRGSKKLDVNNSKFTIMNVDIRTPKTRPWLIIGER